MRGWVRSLWFLTSPVDQQHKLLAEGLGVWPLLEGCHHYVGRWVCRIGRGGGGGGEEKSNHGDDLTLNPSICVDVVDGILWITRVTYTYVQLRERSHSHAYGTDYIGPIW